MLDTSIPLPTSLNLSYKSSNDLLAFLISSSFIFGANFSFPSFFPESNTSSIDFLTSSNAEKSKSPKSPIADDKETNFSSLSAILPSLFSVPPSARLARLASASTTISSLSISLLIYLLTTFSSHLLIER